MNKHFQSPSLAALSAALLLALSACGGGGGDTPAEASAQQGTAQSLGEPAQAEHGTDASAQAADEGQPDAQQKAAAAEQQASRAQRLGAHASATTPPCSGTGCTQYNGTMSQVGQNIYHPGSDGFDWKGGSLKGWLQGPSGTDFDLVLGKWDRVAASEGYTSVENISYNASAGRYRWRVNAYSGTGSYTLWTQATSSPTDPGTYGTCDLPNFAADVLARINRERARGATCGGTVYPPAPALAWNSQLAQAADRHSKDMQVNNFFSHTGSDGSTMSQRVSATGYSWSALGENIAAGQSSVDSVFNSWMASAGHCQNIMNARYVHYGISCRSGDSHNTYSKYWTLDLGKPM